MVRRAAARFGTVTKENRNGRARQPEKGINVAGPYFSLCFKEHELKIDGDGFLSEPPKKNLFRFAFAMNKFLVSLNGPFREFARLHRHKK